MFIRGRPLFVFRTDLMPLRNFMILVMKFGGTSVADAPAFENVGRIVAQHRDSRPVVVVSAMSGMTDALVASADLAKTADTETAMKSLAPLFERHEQVAKSLLKDIDAQTICLSSSICG